MNRDNHTVSQIKFNLGCARRKGKGFVVAQANSKVRQTLRDMDCQVDPYEYEVILKFPFGFKPRKSTAHIIKDLYYYMVKNHKNKRILHLSPSQVRDCKNFGLEVITRSYKIY